MEDIDYFREVKTVAVDEMKSALKRQTPRDYTLLDARQPDEYQESPFRPPSIFHSGN